MSGIVKRKKTSNYLQLHNYPVQQDLKDLEAIGLLTYIMSLPEDWVLYKTQLQSTFSRRKVDAAWKVLAQKKYLVGFICYVDGKKTYFYNVSDIAFTQEQYDDFVNDTLEELVNEGEKVTSVSEMPDNPYKITTARFVQYVLYSTNCTATKEKETKEKETKETLKDFVNNKAVNNIEKITETIPRKQNKTTNLENNDPTLEDIINRLVNEYRLKGLNKDVCLRAVNEAVANKQYIHNFGGYLRSILETTLHRVKVKTGEIDPIDKFSESELPLYDWLRS